MIQQEFDFKEPETITTKDIAINNTSDISVKFIKLKTGEDLVSMVEWNLSSSVEGTVVLYNPFKLIHEEYDNSSPIKKVGMEEWLPFQIVQEQVCTIFEDDILTMTELNEAFLNSYNIAVIKKVQLQELLRRGKLGDFDPRSSRNELALSEEESEESDFDDFQEKLQAALKKMRGGYN